VAGQHSWIVELDGYPATSTDELTLDEVAIAEQVSGVSWYTMNPLANIKVAKALLVLVSIRAGMPEAEAITLAGTIPLKRLHGVFTLVLGDTVPPGAEGGGADPPASAPTSGGG
jgi:hypothetical protein